LEDEKENLQEFDERVFGSRNDDIELGS